MTYTDLTKKAVKRHLDKAQTKIEERDMSSGFFYLFLALNMLVDKLPTSPAIVTNADPHHFPVREDK